MVAELREQLRELVENRWLVWRQVVELLEVGGRAEAIAELISAQPGSAKRSLRTSTR